jgi:hypothetical protein
LPDETLDSLLGSTGTETLTDLIDQLGLSDFDLIDAHVGDFVGLIPALLSGVGA